ncbi:hypothetical protein FD50_GL001356 [Liquorilactobacillus satsumensis DSM 16230 = JCM 12392]|uniref:Uncharacterized protein n=1 Tax=Liquorilactobacillus satsumensis DSM 16230 = JCM 12392 TaxID=1423801 RepID=A0A0R1V1U2_9LACO|nr:hypothetical protein FD50_GL001356 [Liquorilactobacillus satsumensis DSM 16230 = JCM 12392]
MCAIAQNFSKDFKDQYYFLPLNSPSMSISKLFDFLTLVAGMLRPRALNWSSTLA